ncbi:MAG: C40 family peptidase [Chitinophagaceae bacterium]|nr:C40 family peptidase [Chitinophagaceae bacterium]
MNTIYCQSVCAPVRFSPDHRAEMHTQLLYGDITEAIEQQRQWVKLHLPYESRDGWALYGQFMTGIPDATDAILLKDHYFQDLQQWRFRGTRMPSSVFLTESKLIRGIHWETNQDLHFTESRVLSLLQNLLHTPYLWGGNTSSGIDCSGLSRLLYRFFGLDLPHYASAQMSFGDTVDFLAHAHTGDLAFFDNEQGEINHVGILMSPNEIIHAGETNASVAIDAIDSDGIINKKTKLRTHHLRMVKRLMDFSTE